MTKRTLYDRFGSKDGLVTAYLQQRHDTWWASLEQRLAHADRPRALAVFDAYDDHTLAIDRGCAFLNGAAELPADHAGLAVIRAHKHAVHQRLVDLIAEDCPDIKDPQAVANHLFLLLEGAIAHRGIDGDDHRLKQARELALGLLCR